VFSKQIQTAFKFHYNAENMGEFLADMGMGFILAFGYGVYGYMGVFFFFFFFLTIF
jgi:hypothetical protein